MPANFGSDNSSGVHPSIVEALVQASVGAAPAYGADALTKRVESRLASFSTLQREPRPMSTKSLLIVLAVPAVHGKVWLL